MKAIITKYHGPGNVVGSRISAADQDRNKIYISYPHDLDTAEAHLLAAKTLCKKMKWTGKLHQGSLKDHYVHVFENGKGASI